MLLITILDILVGLTLYLVYRLRGRFGLAPLFALVATGFFLQALSAPAVGSPLVGDLLVFTAPVVLVGAGIFAVLLVLLAEGVGATRRLVYSVVVTAALLGVLAVAIRWGLASGVLLSLSPGTELFRFVDIRVLVFSTGLFFIDAIAAVAIHEILAARVRWLPSVGRILLSLVPVLLLDGLLLFVVQFDAGPQVGFGAMGGLLAGNIFGRVVSGIVYGLMLWAFLRLSSEVDTRGTAEIRDPLSMFTHRERMELLEKQKERSDASLRNLFESNIVGMKVTTLQGQILSANDHFLELIGHERSDLPLDWVDLTPREWQALDHRMIEEITATGSGQLWEKEFVGKDGRRVPALVAMTPATGDSGECLAVVLDLSQRKQAEAALKESESLYRSLYDDIPLMYFTLDPDGIILLVNKHGAQELGYAPHELIGQPVLGIFHPEDQRAVAEGFEAFVRNPEGIARWEFRKVRKDGSILWVRESVRAVAKTEGHTEIMVVCENITDRKEAERKILEHERQLKALMAALPAAEERERRQIATGLHDEVGQVLAMVKGKLEALGASEAARDPSRLARETTEIRTLVSRSIDFIRTLTFDLGSPVLYELGLEAGLQNLVERVESRHGVRFRRLFQGDQRRARRYTLSRGSRARAKCRQACRDGLRQSPDCRRRERDPAFGRRRRRGLRRHRCREESAQGRRFRPPERPRAVGADRRPSRDSLDSGSGNPGGSHSTGGAGARNYPGSTA
jgi:PAS domain S-box-containing protein